MVRKVLKAVKETGLKCFSPNSKQQLLTRRCLLFADIDVVDQAGDVGVPKLENHVLTSSSPRALYPEMAH
jgi:hypothetical protein